MENENTEIRGLPEEFGLPEEVTFGARRLLIPDDITPKESAQLAVVLGFAASGVLRGNAQVNVDVWLENMGVSRLFIVD